MPTPLVWLRFVLFCCFFVLFWGFFFMQALCSANAWQTEKTIRRQYQRVDWPWMEHPAAESWETWRVEEADCRISSGVPTVSQTTRWVKVKVNACVLGDPTYRKSLKTQPPLWPRDNLVGLIVKASASRVEDPGFESRLPRDFAGVESYRWLKNWHSSGYPSRRLAL